MLGPSARIFCSTEPVRSGQAFPARYQDGKALAERSSFPPLFAATLKPRKQKAANPLARALKSNVKLNKWQFGALISWAYNVGPGAAASSTLVRHLNEGRNPQSVIKKQLPRWRIPAVLIERRKKEIAFSQRKPTGPKFSPKVC
jgi:hypothetical protein